MANLFLGDSYWLICMLFCVAALLAAMRERCSTLYFNRTFSVLVVALAIVLVLWQGQRAPRELLGLGHDQISHSEPVVASYLEQIAFSGERIFAVLSVGILAAGVLFCPSAPLVNPRMSRVFAVQAVLYGLIHVESIELFLLLGIIITLSFILWMRDDRNRIIDDERRFIRARSFIIYHSVGLMCMLLSLILRILDHAGVLLFSAGLQVIDLVALCIASAIAFGIFPFHGWILPFLGSPRSTVFIPMLCMQSGLLFFFRIYAPIVSAYTHNSAVFVGIPVIGLLYSAVLFFGETRLKRIPGNLYLNHACLMAITVVGLDMTTYTAAILDGVNTVVAVLGLSGLCALLTSRFGVRGVISPTGLGSLFPEVAVCYLVYVLSLVSFPGTLGFIEEEVLLGQAVGHHNLLVAAIAIALTLNGFTSFRLFARVFLGQPALGQDTETALLWRERAVIYAILAVILVNGLAPSYLVETLSLIK